MEDRERRDPLSRITRLLACDLKHHSRAGVLGDWNHNPPAQPQTLEPYCSRVGDAGIDENRVDGPRIVIAAVAFDYLDSVE